MIGTTNILHVVACRGPSTCVAVGNGGRILGTTNGGSTWRSQPSAMPNPLRGMLGNTLEGVVQAMEADGLLLRRDLPNNRFTLVLLTEVGHSAVAPLPAQREAVRAPLLAGVPEADTEGTGHYLRYIRDRRPDA